MKRYLETLIAEKAASGSPHNIDQGFVVDGPSGQNHMTYQTVVDAIAQTHGDEQKAIRNVLVLIDFRNGDVFTYFRHLAQALAL